jgi:hypothetical protein
MVTDAQSISVTYLKKGRKSSAMKYDPEINACALYRPEPVQEGYAQPVTEPRTRDRKDPAGLWNPPITEPL